MKYYSFNQTDKTFTFTGEADESPLEPGVFLLPAHATFSKPPVAEELQAAVFDELTKSWSLVADYRGKVYYKPDGSIVGITELSAVPEVDWTTEPPAQPPQTLPSTPEELVVTPWQIRQALNQLGLRAQIETFVANTTNQDVKDGWNYATEWREFHPVVQLMGQQLGLTANQIHAVFILAKEK